jgi:hypothetical protein
LDEFEVAARALGGGEVELRVKPLAGAEAVAREFFDGATFESRGRFDGVARYRGRAG